MFRGWPPRGGQNKAFDLGQPEAGRLAAAKLKYQNEVLIKFASCLAASVDLDVSKKRLQESMTGRDLGIVFGTLCPPGRRKKETARIDGLSRFGHCVWAPLSS